MKKYIYLLLCCILLMLIPMLGGCTSEVEQPKYETYEFYELTEPPEITAPTTQENEDDSAEYTIISDDYYSECLYSKQEDEFYEPGVIMGDLFFESFKLCLLFVGPVSDVLPPPNGQRDNVYFFFDGFEIMAMSGLDSEASQVDISPPNLSSLTLNGTELNNDMTRVDVRYLLGEPTEYSGDWMLVYHVTSLTRDSWLIFRFTCPDEDATIQSITIQ